MTPREQRIFRKRTKDFDQESRESLRNHINGMFREIKKNVPAELRKYTPEQLTDQEADIAMEILEERRENVVALLEVMEDKMRAYC